MSGSNWASATPEQPLAVNPAWEEAPFSASGYWASREGRPPRVLYHVTTGRKAKLYRQTGQIHGPVRGFDTLLAAMAWAMQTGRKVIFWVNPLAVPHKMPDHHNAFGSAWWTETVPMDRVKCAFSAEGAWPEPDRPAQG